LIKVVKCCATMAVDAREAAKKFVEKLGIVGEAAFAALLAPDVETRDDNGKCVPAEVKKAWQRWCQKGHPDRGGSHKTMLQMQQEYDAFKLWFKEHPTRPSMDRATMLSEHHKRGITAEAAAQKSREENCHDEAMVFATQAIDEHRALYDVYTLEKKAKMKIDAARDLQRAQDLFDAIRMEVEEIVKGVEEQKRRNESEQVRNQEHQELTLGLERLLKFVLGDASHGPAIPQKYEELVTFLAGREQQHKDAFAELKDDRVEMDRSYSRQLIDAKQKLIKEQAQVQQLLSEVSRLKADNTYLRTQQDEAMQEANADNNAGFKFLGWIKDLTGLGPSSHPSTLTAILKAKNEKAKHETMQVHEHLGQMERTIEKQQQEIAQNEKHITQSAREIGKLKEKVAESESSKAKMKAQNAENRMLKNEMTQLEAHVGTMTCQVKEWQLKFDKKHLNVTELEETLDAFLSQSTKEATKFASQITQLQEHVFELESGLSDQQKLYESHHGWSLSLSETAATRIEHLCDTAVELERLCCSAKSMVTSKRVDERLRLNQHNYVANQTTTEGPLTVALCTGLEAHISSTHNNRHTYRGFDEADRQVRCLNVRVSPFLY